MTGEGKPERPEKEARVVRSIAVIADLIRNLLPRSTKREIPGQARDDRERKPERPEKEARVVRSIAVIADLIRNLLPQSIEREILNQVRDDNE